MTGMETLARFDLKARRNSHPSRLGIIRSRVMMSGLTDWIRLRAWSALAA